MKHEAAAAATFRHLYHLSLYEVGTPTCRWGEAVKLIEVAAGDPSTWLGAEYAELRYPASPAEIYGMWLAIGRTAATRQGAKALREAFMPFPDRRPRGSQKFGKTSTDEYREATARLMCRFGIAEEQWADELDTIVTQRS